MDEQEQHYLRDYWKEAPGRARRDVLRYFRKEIAWRVLELVVLVVAFLGPLLWDYVTKGRAVFNSTLWPDLWHGALLSAGVLVLGVLWQLFVVTPARIRREDLSSIKVLKDDSAARRSEIASQPNLTISIEDSVEDKRRKEVLLEIANSGGAAESVDVRIAFGPSGFSPRLHGTYFLEGGQGMHLAGGLRPTKLLIASVESLGSVEDFRWSFRCTDLAGNRKNTQLVFAYNSIPQSIPDGSTFTIEVVSKPASQSGPVVKEVIVSGRRWIVKPPLVSPSTVPPSSTTIHCRRFRTPPAGPATSLYTLMLIKRNVPNIGTSRASGAAGTGAVLRQPNGLIADRGRPT